nr:MAG TPA: hypothetical protein [Bacteriophage sp.]
MRRGRRLALLCPIPPPPTARLMVGGASWFPWRGPCLRLRGDYYDAG